MQPRLGIYLITYFGYTGIHALRASYSYNKADIADSAIIVSDIGLVDTLMLMALAAGFLQHSLFIIGKPVRAATIALLLIAVLYSILPLVTNQFQGPGRGLASVCILMTVNGYLQSYVWPTFLSLINQRYDSHQDSTLIGLWATCANSGNILGFLLCQLTVISLGLSWSVPTELVAGTILVSAVFFWVYAPQSQNRPQRESNTQAKGLLNGSESQITIWQVISDKLFISITVTFSLIKSIEYGILLWLPMYFQRIGFGDSAAYISVAFDCASIVSSILMGRVFRSLQNKTLFFGVAVLLQLMLFVGLRVLDLSLSGYYGMVVGVGLCIGGTYNLMASLVVVWLVRNIPSHLQSQSVRLYSACLFFAANLITALTQLLIGAVLEKNEILIFTVFVWYSLLALVSLGYSFFEERNNSREIPVAPLSLQIGVVH